MTLLKRGIDMKVRSKLMNHFIAIMKVTAIGVADIVQLWQCVMSVCEQVIFV